MEPTPAEPRPGHAKPLTTNEEVLRVASLLRDFASHHAPTDWDYSRDLHEMTRIAHKSDWTGSNRPIERARRLVPTVLRSLRAQDPIDRLLEEGQTLCQKIAGRLRSACTDARLVLLPDRNLPDGTLANGTVITYWEEDGEYIQLVQPTVGLLIADFLAQCPDHPHARAVAAEIARVQERYARRVAQEG